MKCKTMKEISNEKKTKTKNGRSAIKGNCHVCGTKMFKFVK